MTRAGAAAGYRCGVRGDADAGEPVRVVAVAIVAGEPEETGRSKRRTATPAAPYPRMLQPFTMTRWAAGEMIQVIDTQAALRAAAAGLLRCPDCDGPLRRWSNARSRTVEMPGDRRQSVTPPRVRCRVCGRTHVLVEVTLLPRRAYGSDVVVAALVAAADGTGHRPIAARLGVPEGTVRGWLRRARHHAEATRARALQVIVALDPDQVPDTPRPTRLAEALDAMAVAAHLVAVRWKMTAPLRHLALIITGGRLLSPSPSG